jgi:hypothetical protein
LHILRLGQRIETAVEAVEASDVLHRDRSRRPVAGAPERLRQRLHARIDRNAVREDAVPPREERRQHRRVTRTGRRQRDVGLLEEQAVFRKPVEERRGLPAVAVAAEMVGAQRVDRDEHDVRLRRRRGRGGEQCRDEKKAFEHQARTTRVCEPAGG